MKAPPQLQRHSGAAWPDQTCTTVCKRSRDNSPMPPTEGLTTGTAHASLHLTPRSRRSGTRPAVTASPTTALHQFVCAGAPNGSLPKRPTGSHRKQQATHSGQSPSLRSMGCRKLSNSRKSSQKVQYNPIALFAADVHIHNQPFTSDRILR